MKPAKETVRARRSEDKPSHWGELRLRVRAAGGLPAAAMAALLAAGILLMDLWPVDPLPYRVGQYVSQDIRARVSFTVPSEEQKGEAFAKARATTPAVFDQDANLRGRLIAELKALPHRLEPFTQPSTMPESLRKPFAVEGEEALDAWKAALAGARAEEYAKQVEQAVEQVLRVPLVRPKEKADQLRRGAPYALFGGERRPTDDLIGLDEPNRVDAHVRRACRDLPAPLRPGVESQLLSLLRQQPLWTHDPVATQKDIDEAIRAIEANPPVDTYRPGDVLVTRLPGERMQFLSQRDIDLLRREHEEFQKEERKHHPIRFWLRIAGREALLLAVLLLLFAYVLGHRPKGPAPLIESARLAALLLALVGAAKVLAQGTNLPAPCASLPVVAGALVFCIAYEQRFALAMSVALSLLTGFVTRTDLFGALALAASVAVAVPLLREVRTRTKMILVSGAAGLAVMLTTWAAYAARSEPWWPVAVTDGLWGAGFAVLAGFLVQGVLPLVELAFGAVTSMTLLEWCDADKPLLRRLRLEAPGTYSHSLQLGALCEAAAEEVGARGLLARAGAYYHDVGKINKPEYFVENQAGSPSRHDRLSPAMSLLIITGHVRDGLELAREYRLPKLLHEFIATHHGTTLAQYFFQAETERRKADEEPAPEDVEFRYPGPRPRSKEAAILMLADAAESSIRSMAEPAPGRIENQVHAIVQRRLMDGQLDECDLTLREVGKIEESFVKSLTAMYHTRIAYPTPPGEEPSAAEMPPAAKTVPPPSARDEEKG